MAKIRKPNLQGLSTRYGDSSEEAKGQRSNILPLIERPFDAMETASGKQDPNITEFPRRTDSHGSPKAVARSRLFGLARAIKEGALFTAPPSGD